MSIKAAYSALADFNLWIKVMLDEQFYMGDMPALIPYKIKYIIDRWEYLRPGIVSQIESSINPDVLSEQIYAFDNYAANKRIKSNELVNANELLSAFYAIFDLIGIDDFENSKQEKKLIEKEIKRVSNFYKKDYERMQRDLFAGRDIIFDQTGSSNKFYDETYRRSPASTILSPNLRDYRSAYTFHDIGMKLDELIVNVDTNSSDAIVDPFLFAKNNANNPEIDIKSYASGRISKLNYGETLQQFAARTLGSYDRWMEIVIANGLKPPYIDEKGEMLPLASNASGSIITLPKLDSSGKLNKEKVYVGQIIFIQSDEERVPSQRSVANIREVPISGDIILELTGEGNLSKYRRDDNASIRVYKPNTANSLFYIVVPSEEPLNDTIAMKELPWFLKNVGQDEVRAKIDFKLHSSGDLVFKSDGDVQMAYGVENAAQAIKLIISTQIGTLIRHQQFGIPSSIGSKNSNAAGSAAEMESNIRTQIESDPRFGEVRSLDVELNMDSAPTFIVNIEVALAGSDSPIPLTFTIAANI
jgi:hypothetical protein